MYVPKSKQCVGQFISGLMEKIDLEREKAGQYVPMDIEERKAKQQEQKISAEKDLCVNE